MPPSSRDLSWLICYVGRQCPILDTTKMAKGTPSSRRNSNNLDKPSPDAISYGMGRGHFKHVNCRG